MKSAFLSETLLMGYEAAKGPKHCFSAQRTIYFVDLFGRVAGYNQSLYYTWRSTMSESVWRLNPSIQPALATWTKRSSVLTPSSHCSLCVASHIES